MFCHFRISIAGSPPQTVVFKLYTDKCPKTCDNFVALCQSSATAKRPSKSTSAINIAVKNEPTYRGTEFHRVLPGFMAQAGDFTNFDGSGGHAAPTTNSGSLTFPDENFTVSHNREGILSMANRGKNTNGSQFFITLGKTSLHLDGKHVAFGEVVRGMEVVNEIARVETEGDNGKPTMLQRVVIVDCGVGTGDDKSSDSDGSSCSSSESSSLEDRDRKRRKKSSSKKKKRHKHRRSRSSDSDEDPSREQRKRSRSKHKKKYDKYDNDDHKRMKRKDKSSHKHRRKEHSSMVDEDRDRRSSKKRHKSSDRHDDDIRDRKKKPDRR